MPALLNRSTSNANKASLYAGFFDIANSKSTWPEIENALKFAVIFYNRILVPDGFFHCYGPLFSELQNYQKKSVVVPLRIDTLSEHYPLLSMLRAGIVVPAIRMGDSIHANWDKEIYGVMPGEYMTVRREDGEGVLRMVDQHARYYEPWPAALDPRTVDRRSRFATQIFRLFLSEESPFCVKHPVISKDIPPWVLNKERIAVQELYDEFAEVLLATDRDKNFRRGNVEQYVEKKLRKNLGYGLSSYGELTRRIDWGNSNNTFFDSNAYLILSVTATAYQLMQAAEFDAVAALFPTCDDPVVSVNRIQEALYSFAAGSMSHKRRPIEFGSLDLSSVTLEQAMRFRRKLIFGQYIELLEGIRVPPVERSFWEENYDFVEFVRTEYLAAILEEFPSAGEFVKKLNVVADTAGLDGNTMNAVREIGSIGGNVVFGPFFSAVGSAIKVASYWAQVGPVMRKKNAMDRFTANNYAYWRGTPHGNASKP